MLCWFSRLHCGLSSAEYICVYEETHNKNIWSINTSLGCPTRDKSRVWYRINSANNQLISKELLQKIDNRYTFKTTISGEVISVAFLKDNNVFISKRNNNTVCCFSCFEVCVCC